jgi:hypothetical protein
MRVHKNFIKSILDKNFNVILSHIENKVEKDVFLQEIQANINGIVLRIQPKNNVEWDGVETDLFFD